MISLKEPELSRFKNKVYQLSIANSHFLRQLWPGWEKNADEIISGLTAMLASMAHTLCLYHEQANKWSAEDGLRLYVMVLRSVIEMLITEHDNQERKLSPQAQQEGPSN